MAACPTCGHEPRPEEALQVAWRSRSGAFDSLQCAAAGLGLLCDHCAAPLLGRLVAGPGGGVFCGPGCMNRGPREAAARTKHDVAGALANAAGAGRRL